MTSIPQLLDSNVRKPTALIHFERSLSVVEQKVMTLIIFHCQVAEKDEQGFYYIKKNFVREFLGWEGSKNYQRLYEAFLGIYNNSIQWNVLGADRTFRGGICRLIVSLLQPTETGQYIGFKLHPDLEPVIKDPKVFAKLKLVMLVLLSRSQYAYPLYELFADSHSRGQPTRRLSLAALKTYLGIGEGYGLFKDFKTWVLKPSLESINALTDFRVTYQTYREGRSIGGLVFHLCKQPWQPPNLEGSLRELRKYYQQLPLPEVMESAAPLSAEQQAFVREMEQRGVAEADARQVLEIHGLEGALEIRDYVLAEIARRQGKPDEIRNSGAYLMRCFREGFGRKTTEEQTAERRRRQAAAIAQAQQQARENQRAEIDAVIKAFQQWQAEQVGARLAMMTTQERETFDQAFIRANPIWGKTYQEGKPASPLVHTAFQRFAAERLLDSEQRDLIAFAHARGLSPEAINLLRMMA